MAKEGHSLMKIIEVMVRGGGKYARREEGEGYKRKHLCIASITGGAPRSSVPSKGIIKSKIVELMVVSKKEESTPVINLERSILGF